jgi:hypothetical protein
MERARRHQRLLSGLAFGLLALVAELAGRSLTHRFDFGRHVATPSYGGADYYPILLIVVKGAIALLVARLAWRFVRARAAEQGALRLIGEPARLPRPRFELSGRRCLVFFALTSVIFLVQTDAEGAAAGRWPLLSPWLHSSALPAFALLSVACALLWGVVRSWLADYEEYAQASVERAQRLAGRVALRVPRPSLELSAAPRSIFGLAFESRPPPLPA